jgi:membrane-associated phospholipid phosphatase
MNKYINVRILRTLLQFAHFILACWISITRINDYMHHPEDVIMGAIVGVVCVYIVMYREKHYVQECEKQKNKEKSSEILGMCEQ